MPSPLAFMLLSGTCPGCQKDAGTKRKKVKEKGETVTHIVCKGCGTVIDKEWPKK